MKKDSKIALADPPISLARAHSIHVFSTEAPQTRLHVATPHYQTKL
jgi:hypothetical protein